MFRTQSLATLSVGRTNNLNLLRMVGATLVLFSHSFWLTGTGSHEPLVRLGAPVDLAGIGVILFFGVSGFLITQSILRDPSVGRYAARRALRLVPGLAVAGATTVLVGCAATTVPSIAYWTSSDTWAFLLGTPVLMLRETLPGVFRSNPFAAAVNGSLWTIPVEVTCYAAIAGASVLGFARRPLTLLIFSVIFVAGCARFPELVQSLMPFRVPPTVTLLIGTFFAGSVLCVFRRFVPVSLTLATIVACIIVASHHTRAESYLLFCAAPYIALVIAYHPRLQVPVYLRLGDYSYGTYVLAFPIQQYVVWRFGLRDPIHTFMLSAAAVLPLAVLSWHFVEKRALAFKGRLPSRPVSFEAVPVVTRARGIGL